MAIITIFNNMEKLIYQSPAMLGTFIPEEAILAESGGMVTPEIIEEQVTEW